MLSTLPAKIFTNIATHLSTTDIKNFRLVSQSITNAIFETFAKRCYRRFKLNVSPKNVDSATAIFHDAPRLPTYIEELHLEFPGSHKLQDRRDALDLYNRRNPHIKNERLPDLRTIEALKRGESREVDEAKLSGYLKGLKTLKISKLNERSLVANMSFWKNLGNGIERLALKECLLSSEDIEFLLSTITTSPFHLTIKETKFSNGLPAAIATLLTFELNSLELHLHRESDEDRVKFKQEDRKRVQKFFHMGKGNPIEHFQIYGGWMRMSGRRGVREGLEWGLRTLLRDEEEVRNLLDVAEAKRAMRTAVITE